MPSLRSDIVGQVARLPLRPSEANALLPLFEAVSNSLHAIQEEWAAEVAERGAITVEILRDGSAAEDDAKAVIGFVITDNGAGLNDANFKSFLTPFSQLKMQKGGKGIGRLGWLKVFRHIRLESFYRAGGALAERAFDFVLREEDQVVPAEGSSGLAKVPGTRVILKDFDGAYGPMCPSSKDVIVQRIVAHFLPVFAGLAAPKITVLDGTEQVGLKEYFEEKVMDSDLANVTFEIGGGNQSFILRHMRCDKSIRPRGGQNNWICLCADDRGVKEYGIDEQIGLQLLNGEEIYIGAVSSDFLDAHVNPQRTDFTFEPDESREIRRRLADSVRGYLHEYILKAQAQKKTITQAVIEKNPQYLYLHGELDDFVEALRPNSQTEEAIYLEMSQNRYRRQRRFKGIEREIIEADQFSSAVIEKVEEYSGYLAEDQKGALAEYVIKRKSILDLLGTLRGFKEALEGGHHLEDAKHSLVCPMRVESSELVIEDHNLWILDDRLAFFKFFASDRPISQITDVASGREPDIALFYDSCIAWRESDKACDTVILVEFKRPGLDSYSDKNDPYMQVMDYITRFKSATTVRDRKGNVISGIGPRTAFHSYIVADLTAGLRKRLRGRLQPTPDGRGLFGYTVEPDSYIEVIPYEKLLGDAQARNAIFFDKLGLNG
jgi:hypothetical protein